MTNTVPLRCIMQSLATVKRFTRIEAELNQPFVILREVPLNSVFTYLETVNLLLEHVLGPNCHGFGR
jgi:hypothetical protein